MFIFYNLIFLIFMAMYFPYLFFKGKYHPEIWQRFRCILSKPYQGKKAIWIHAVSVGEVLAVVDLVKQLKKEFSGYAFVLSTVTKTGHGIAQEQLKGVCEVIYAPVDLSWIVQKFIRVIQPKIYIAAETEIWPNLYTALYQNNVPIIQINGRISDKAFRGYAKVYFLTKGVLHCVRKFCMQSSSDAQRIIELGANPERVEVVGNMKFDGAFFSEEETQQSLGFNEGDELFIAGSTHPGEEEIIIDIYQKLVKEFSHLRLVITPRHIERTQEVLSIIESAGLNPVKFSSIHSVNLAEKGVVVVDTMGQLRKLYAVAKVVFIGKTFKVGGGQNMIEPAAFGKPVFVGSHTQNFKGSMNLFLKADAIVQVETPDELGVQMRAFLQCPEKMIQMGLRAKEVVAKHQGATEKTIEEIRKLLR